MGESLLTASPRFLERIANAVGTPVYVYSVPYIREQWRLLSAALAAIPHRVHFSVKANSNLAILGILRDLGAGVDIVSGGELSRVLRVGFSGRDIVFSGVGKTHEELRRAVETKVALINVESDVEFDALANIVATDRSQANVGIRINPNVTTDTHPYTQTGHSGMKFGVPLDQVEALAVRMAQTPGITLLGLGMHLGSQIADPTRYDEGIGRLVELVDRLQAQGITTIQSLDIGGGFAISYGDRAALDLNALSLVVARVSRETGLRTLVEPGRFLIGNAGTLLTRVLYRKASGGRSFVIVDAGMNDFIRPSFYQAHHDIDVLTTGVLPDDAPPGPVDVVGPICESSDFQALERVLPPIGPGALLAIRGAGAYGFSMSSTYNSRPRVPEVLTDGDRYAIARDREEVDRLWKGERLDPAWHDAESAAAKLHTEEIT